MRSAYRAGLEGREQARQEWLALQIEVDALRARVEALL
jgi:hypothetical protein